MNTNKQINIMILLVFISVFATGAYWLWDPERADDAKGVQLGKQMEYGAWVFSQNCRVCHGNQGEGGAASNRLRSAPALNRPDLQGKDAETGEVSAAAKKAAYNLVFNTITCGRVGKAMPTWGIDQGGTLNGEQIRQLTLLITEGTAWEDAEEFALEGVPAFGKHGDAYENYQLARPVAEGDTEIFLNFVADALDAGGRLLIGEELVLIQSVDREAKSITVERGLGTTNAEAHEPGVEILTQPVPPDPAPITQPACGQNLPAAVPTGAPEAPSTTLSIIAQGIAWNKSALSAIAGQPLTLTVDNRDDGTVHNIHFFEGAEPGGDDVAQTDLEAGPVVQTLNFGPLAAGEYYYVCDVHPGMEGVLTAAEETTPAPAP